MPQRPNGSNRTLTGILTGILILVIGSGFGFAVSEAKTAQQDLMQHQLGPGHATMIERTKTLEKAILEIKASLRRIEDKLP